MVYFGLRRGAPIARIFSSGMSGYLYGGTARNGTTHISTSACTRRPRFTARQNPVPTSANEVGPNRPAIQGERDRHEARHGDRGNHEARGNRDPLRLSG